MIPVTYFRERVHGKRVPTGKPLASLTQAVLGMCAADAIRQLRMSGRVDLAHWIPSFTAAAKPMVETFFRAGQQQRARELLAAIEKRRKVKSLGVRKSFPISFGFDIFNPRVTQFIDTATYAFVESTLKTAGEDAVNAYRKFRQELGTSLQSGEGVGELNRRIYSIFRDPYRASRAGQTEAARSMAGGGYVLAEQSGATKVRWQASSDACPVCQDLNGQEREIGKPFLILPKSKPPYNVIYHSPAHVFCYCTETYIVDDNVNVDRLRVMAYDPAQVPSRFRSA